MGGRTRSVGWLVAVAVAVAVAVGGCHGSPTTPDMYQQDPLVRDRPFDLVVPDSYTAGQPAPLVVLLHGYTFDGFFQEAYFNLTKVAQAQGFLYAIPDGTKNAAGKRF